MRVKHWQGYGSVNVKKVNRTEHDGIVDLHLTVWGNHEWGLERCDAYDVVRWIGTRCDKALTDCRQVIKMETNDYYRNYDEEVCDYYITYRIST